MAELTFKSPGVSTREIDLSGPTALGPQGTPAGIIGTALKGRAFVPITVATFQDFVAEFGATDGEKFGPLAMNEWMRNARAGTYVRVLGVGDGKQRNSSSGIVTNAGFVVGQRLVRQTGEANVGLQGSASDLVNTVAGVNPFAIAPKTDDVQDVGAGPGDAEKIDRPDDRPQPLGRMTFLGALMKDQNSSGLLADSGISSSALGARATLSTAAAEAEHGLDEGQNIVITSTDGTARTYMVMDLAKTEADTTAASFVPIVAGAAAGANAIRNGTASTAADHLTVAGVLKDHGIGITVPVAAGGVAGPTTQTITFLEDGVEAGQFGDFTPAANAIAIKLSADAGTNRTNLILAINGQADYAGSDIKFAPDGQNGERATGVKGLSASEGGANQVTLTAVHLGAHTISTANTGGGSIKPGGAQVTGGVDGVAVPAGTVCLSLSGTQLSVLNAIRSAIISSVGHDGKITVSGVISGTGIQTLTLTQADSAEAGERAITVNTLATISKTDFEGASSTASGKPVLRAAIMVPDGVVLSLASTVAGVSENVNADGEPPASNLEGTPEISAGAVHGTVTTTNGKQNIEIYLNGHVGTGLYPNKIKASLDPADQSYISKVLNTDPTKIREAGHYLYAHYDVYPALAMPDDNEVATAAPPAGETVEEAAFVLVGAAGRNAGSATQPNYEDFQERFRTARTPSFISQDFGAGAKNLFKVHALDDGASACDLFKITIENISASSNQNSKFGKFDLVVRGFYDSDSDPIVLESYRGLNFDRSSENYIARRIGDQYAYYDFDQRDGAQKLRVEGAFENRSRYIRVEMSSDVTRGALPQEILPMGFRGHGHLSLDGNEMLAPLDAAGIIAASDIDINELRRVRMLPVPLRRNVAQGLGNKKRSNADLCWGVQFERIDSVDEPNRNSVVDDSIASFTKFFPDHRTNIASAFVMDNEGASAVDGAVIDCDLYNNNLFSLERVQVSVSSDTDRPVVNHWEAAVYRRTGVAAASLTLADGTSIGGANTRFLDPAKDFAHLPSRKYLKFTTFLQQGFDGFNIFDKEKSKLSDIAARREFTDSTNQGGVKGPTISAYRKAVDVMEEKADVEIQLLAIPGIRHPAVTDFAIDSVETRFDAMLIMDIEEKDQTNGFVTGSTDQLTNVTYTVNNFESRNLDSSFAAAYFPDVVITDPTTRANVQCPPSVAVLGAFSLNDSVSHPWFAPAGFTRGALNTVLESQVKLKRANLDALYEADINPITSFPHTPGVVVFGQKTLQAAQSALDRVNVRRLLIDIRRRVKKIANGLLFEPNRVDTLARFSNLVNPVLQQIQTQQGLDRYKVQIDTSTTTQADVENNTIRGKIFLQPTRSLEFISLDFVVTNQGAEI